ncbi:MAG TPA: hypothetical protein VLS88_13825 [Polyangiales bacterium]|nr:hypothetical protein [Polyangiales bacterium]
MDVGGLASLALLAAMAAMGVGILHRLTPFLGRLDCWTYGSVLGAVLGSLLLLLAATLFGLSRPLVIGLGVAAAGAGLALLPRAGTWVPPRLDTLRAMFRSRTGVLVVMVIFGFVLRLALLWSDALRVDREGLWVAQTNLWADWAQHLGDVSSFAYGDNFPPAQTRFVGAPLAYHYLTSVTAAAMVMLGMEPWDALALHSFVFSVAVVLAVYALAKRMTTNRAAAALSVVLFLLGGGLGWTLSMGELVGEAGLTAAALDRSWDPGAQAAANFRWQNVYFSSIAPQRAYLYGLPLFALIVAALTNAVQSTGNRAFVIAGAIAGLLPFAHLGAMLTLAIITPIMFLFFPRRSWLWFFAVWVAVAVPQLLAQQGGTPGALAAFRWAPGWVAAPDPWLWFWLKNLGLFSFVLLFALVDRSLMGRTERRMLGSFMALFVLANLFVFQPWDWDNTKLLVFWYLASCIFVSAWLARAWRPFDNVVVRLGLLVVVISMVLSGALQNLHQLLGLERHLLLTEDEMQLAERVREETGPHAVFLTGQQHNHPIHVLAGRRVVMGYPGWLWSQGYAYEDRERDVRAMFELAPRTDALLHAYEVDYAVIGPKEKDALAANPDAFRARYPSVIRTETYEVFEIQYDSSR